MGTAVVDPGGSVPILDRARRAQEALLALVTFPHAGPAQAVIRDDPLRPRRAGSPDAMNWSLRRRTRTLTRAREKNYSGESTLTHAKARRVRKDHPAVGRCSSVALLLVGGEA
jgi:hypothetical protein